MENTCSFIDASTETGTFIGWMPESLTHWRLIFWNKKQENEEQYLPDGHAVYWHHDKSTCPGKYGFPEVIRILSWSTTNRNDPGNIRSLISIQNKATAGIFPWRKNVLFYRTWYVDKQRKHHEYEIGKWDTPSTFFALPVKIPFSACLPAPNQGYFHYTLVHP